MTTTILLKRAYEAALPTDGFRIYVDHLWPRGLSHETFPYDLWDKEIAPSDTLRHFLHADPDANWPEFVKRYTAEIEANPSFAALKSLVASKKKVTLLYSSHDETHNNAIVLRDALLK